MEELDILDESAELLDRRLGRRPVFLTVLCILTWVGSGLGLISALFQLWSYAAINALSNEFSQASGALGSSERNVFALLFWQSIAGIFAAVMCTVGAVFMWKLRKIGFFLYLIGQLVPLVLSVLSVMSSSHVFGNEFAIFTTGVSLIIPIGFVAMYGVNLKHMH